MGVIIEGESIGLMNAISSLSNQIDSLIQYLQGDFFKYLFAYGFAVAFFSVLLSFAMYKIFDILVRRK